MTNIVWVSKRRGRVMRTPVSFAALLGLIAVFSVAPLFAGYSLGRSTAQQQTPVPGTLMEGELVGQAEDALPRLDAMASRLTIMQARLLRLEAVGKRVVQVAGLDGAEFNFDQIPPMGGTVSDDSPACVGDVLAGLEEIEQQYAVRFHQLSALEEILRDQRVSESLAPSGWPVSDGWISSRYGHRADPITGRNSFHQGIDIAGRAGSDVAVLAGGLVTWAGRRDGYGNMVEVDHGNGYKTRYAHNQTNLVAVGDIVRRGDVIARLGSSGRATGPHVHVELLRSDRHLNPAQALSRLTSPSNDG
ncbi:MAG: M23 family metallopeptidase [Pseudomonadota bacterium]|nr:M23 family metallopeptidase [Pseudomonadota bacterium]